MEQSESNENDYDNRRIFAARMSEDLIDGVRHLAIDRRVPAWKIVEEAVREKLMRERSAADSGETA